MGCIAAKGPGRHPRWPPRWPPSWILLKIQICRGNAKIENIFAIVVKCDRIKYFAVFGSILYVFSRKNGENTHFYSKMV